nr:beta-galactosidase [Streptomyces sp. NEAU-383]
MAVPAHATVTAAEAAKALPHTVSYDKYSVKVDGERLFVWSGEFHYWRLPSPDLWRDVLQKIKASGMNAVSIYFDWAYHSPAKGRYDFTGVRDVDRLLDMAEEAGLYVIARPGPYINAETDGGGFPGWLMTQKGQARSTDPEYLAAAREWLREIDRFLARRQVTDGTGPVLLYQVENELYDPEGRDHIVELSKQVRADGITVPLVGNEPMPQYAGGEGLDFVGELDQYNSFCKGEWWLPALKRQQDDAPLAIFEAGTGWFQTRANRDTGTQFLYLRHGDPMAGADATTTFDWKTPDGTYPVTARLNGKTGKILVAGHDLGGRQRLVYSTSELLTSARTGNRTQAVLYGGEGDPGQTMLRYPSKPKVTVIGGKAGSTWDAERGDLKLDYTHTGLTRVLLQGGGRPALLLLIGTDDRAADFWRQDTQAGPVLERGTELVRTAAVTGRTLALTGDARKAGPLEVFAPPGVRGVTWNDVPLKVKPTASGSLLGTVPGPKEVTLPELTGWKTSAENPETDPDFDDSSWTYADKLTTDNPTKPGTLPVLYQDEYGYHYGYVWYRGRFKATGTEKSLSLAANATNPDTSSAAVGAYSVWINGQFAGTARTGRRTFPIADRLLRKGKDNMISVLVGTMGHNEDFTWNSDDHKQPRGLTTAYLAGSDAQITWRVQGARGGEKPVDTVRGHMNNGGLYGERAGWTMPDSPDRDYRALIYVNGWLMGQYVNDTGPQHTFPLPRGILRADGRNTIAIASWSEDAKSGGLGKVGLTTLGNVTSSLRVADVAAPAYDAITYADPPTPARVTVDAPDTVEPDHGYRMTAEVSVPDGGKPLRDLTLGPDLPDGWTATPTAPVRLGTLKPGASARVKWTISVSPDQKTGTVAVLAATAEFTRRGKPGSVTGEQMVAAQPPPLRTGEHYVSDLPFQSSSNGWGPVERDRSVGENAEGDGRPLTLHDNVYEKGLGTHAASSVQVWLGGTCTAFRAALGLDQETYGRSDGPATVAYTVLADGTPVYESATIGRDTATQKIDVDVAGARRLELVVSDAGDGNALDHADWADAKLTCGGGA